MDFRKTKVFNFEGALRGMRNPKNSWNKSDSIFRYLSNPKEVSLLVKEVSDTYPVPEEAFKKLMKYGIDFDFNEKGEFVASGLNLIGYNDMTLAKTLINSGTEHRKFLRQIMVSVDITAPIFWWKEWDTYKVGTTANSTSTMHKLADNPITIDNFEIGDYNRDIAQEFFEEKLIPFLENLRVAYKTTKEQKYWKELIRLLPQSYLQTRTVTLNYENILNMYNQRKGHRLNEWSGLEDNTTPNFILWVKSLPYMPIFLGLESMERDREAPTID